MKSKDRLREAIKQVDIVIEGANQPSVVRELEEGRESLERSQELLDGVKS